jgi:DNA-binding NtrC family response regulator
VAQSDGAFGSIEEGGMGEKPHILVVDDDETFRWAVSRALRDQGIAVSETGSCATALDHLAEIGLLVADVRMPHGQPHGFALASMARARNPDLKILFVTAYPELAGAIDHAGAELGPSIAKPAELKDVVREIRRRLEEEPSA